MNSIWAYILLAHESPTFYFYSSSIIYHFFRTRKLYLWCNDEFFFPYPKVNRLLIYFIIFFLYASQSNNKFTALISLQLIPIIYYNILYALPLNGYFIGEFMWLGVVFVGVLFWKIVRFISQYFFFR